MNFELLLNGGICGNFKPKHGLRQDDPMSPLFFILCAKFFSRMINVEESNGNIHGIKVARGSSTISHLLYAADILVTGKATIEEAEAIKGVFEQFKEWSSLKVSNEKFCIFFSPKTNARLKARVKQTLDFKEMK